MICVIVWRLCCWLCALWYAAPCRRLLPAPTLCPGGLARSSSACTTPTTMCPCAAANWPCIRWLPSSAPAAACPTPIPAILRAAACRWAIFPTARWLTGWQSICPRCPPLPPSRTWTRTAMPILPSCRRGCIWSCRPKPPTATRPSSPSLCPSPCPMAIAGSTMWTPPPR